jgi:hypothetical protein
MITIRMVMLLKFSIPTKTRGHENTCNSEDRPTFPRFALCPSKPYLFDFTISASPPPSRSGSHRKPHLAHLNASANTRVICVRCVCSLKATNWARQRMTSPLFAPISARQVFAAQPSPGHRILTHMQRNLAAGAQKRCAGNV